MRSFIWTELGKSEVRNLGFEVAVEKDVASFYVPMYDARIDFVVQIRETSSSSSCNVEASWPINMNQLLSGSCSANQDLIK